MKARELLAKLNNLTLVGMEDGELQWCGSEADWEKSELESLSPSELKEAQSRQESDEYDLRTCHK